MEGYLLNFCKFCRNVRVLCNFSHFPRSFGTLILPRNKGGGRDAWLQDDPRSATCVASAGSPSRTSLSASAFSSKNSPQQLKYRIKFIIIIILTTNRNYRGRGKGMGREGKGEKQLRKVNVGGGGWYEMIIGTV